MTLALILVAVVLMGLVALAIHVSDEEGLTTTEFDAGVDLEEVDSPDSPVIP